MNHRLAVVAVLFATATYMRDLSSRRSKRLRFCSLSDLYLCSNVKTNNTVSCCNTMRLRTATMPSVLNKLCSYYISMSS